MIESIFYHDWQGLVRTLIVSALAYAALVAILRISGSRTLSKMNAFDLIVTVALGSTLATVLLNKSVSLAEGVLALAMLVGLQYVVTWSSVRWKPVARSSQACPSCSMYRGRTIEDAMRRQRVTEAEIRAAIRRAGHSAMEQIEAVVLETDGSLSVISATEPNTSATSLSDVKG